MIANDIYYIGVNDKTLDLFDSIRFQMGSPTIPM